MQTHFLFYSIFKGDKCVINKCVKHQNCVKTNSSNTNTDVFHHLAGSAARTSSIRVSGAFLIFLRVFILIPHRLNIYFFYIKNNNNKFSLHPTYTCTHTEHFLLLANLQKRKSRKHPKQLQKDATHPVTVHRR